MTKIELTEKIIDAIIDMSAECPFEYEDLTPLNLEEATMYLAELKHDEVLAELDPEDRLPNEVTPALYMEVFNCHLRAMKHECHILRLSKYLEDNECVCEYDMFREDYKHQDPIVVPVDFLYDSDGFPFPTLDGIVPGMGDMLQIGLNSARTFRPSNEFCWFNSKTETLYSTNTPFADEIIHARPFAEFILGPDGHEALDYFVNTLMDEDEIMEVFHCTDIEVMDLYSFS